MEAYRGRLKKRVIILWICAALILAAVAIAALVSRDIVLANSDFTGGFIAGFQFGLIALVLAAVAGSAIQYGRAIGNEARLKKLYIAETDERNRYIQDKIGGIGMNASLVLLATAAVISGYFSHTVFFALAAALTGVALIKAGLKLYFRTRV